MNCGGGEGAPPFTLPSTEAPEAAMGRAMTLGRSKQERPRRGHTRREALVLLGAAAATVGSPCPGPDGADGRRRTRHQRSRGAERRHRRDPARHSRGGPLPSARGSLARRCAGLDRGPGSPGAGAARRAIPCMGAFSTSCDLEPLSAIGRHAPRRALVGIVDVRWHQGAELARDPRGDRRPWPSLDRSQHHGRGRQRQPVGASTRTASPPRSPI